MALADPELEHSICSLEDVPFNRRERQCVCVCVWVASPSFFMLLKVEFHKLSVKNLQIERYNQASHRLDLDGQRLFCLGLV